jgi:hypothetical protein
MVSPPGQFYALSKSCNMDLRSRTIWSASRRLYEWYDSLKLPLLSMWQTFQVLFARSLLKILRLISALVILVLVVVFILVCPLV